jgi:hypothetical protein
MIEAQLGKGKRKSLKVAKYRAIAKGISRRFALINADQTEPSD